MTTPGYTPNYNPSRPYALTTITQTYMVYYVHRPIRPNSLDKLYVLDTERYVNRPDLIAFDWYGDQEKWWVVPVRNGLQDPIFDLKLGTKIWIPDPSYVRSIF